MAEVRSQGFTTLKPTDYDPKATLRVLIARPVGDAAGGYRAFFFNKTTFIGNDARANSLDAAGRRARARPRSRSPTASTRRATPPASRAAASACGSSSRATSLTPLDTIPFDNDRFQRRKAA